MSGKDIESKLRKNAANHIQFQERAWKFDRKQNAILKTLLDERTNMVFLSGPAGTSKTFLAVYAALQLMQKDSDLDLLYVRTPIESGSRTMGALPGDANEKFFPYLQPLVDKIEEIVSVGSAKFFLEPLGDEEPRIKAMPVNYLRGANWKNKIVIIDEAQNFNKKELMTAISRIGDNTKVIICGDPEQSDINGNSAFAPFRNIFDDAESSDHGIHSFEFTESDIKRSEILKFIVKKIRELEEKK